MFNAAEEDTLFTLAPIPQGKEGWYRAIDTDRASPRDIVEPGAEERVGKDTMILAARSLVVLLSR